MERIKELRTEYEQISMLLGLPLEIEEIYDLKDRRSEIIEEIRYLAERLNIKEPFWLITPALVN
jgi:hypothetical protein